MTPRRFHLQLKSDQLTGSLRRSAQYLAAPLCLALIIGCSADKSQKAPLGYKQEKPATTATDTAETSATPAALPPIVVAEAGEEDQRLRLTGTLAADEQSKVASSASGIVQEVKVDRGSVVNKGDLLVKIDPRDAENRLAEGVAAVRELLVRLNLKNPDEKFDPTNQPEAKSAKATLDLAQATFKRANELMDKKLIAPEELDRARTEYENARQRYEQALFQASQLYQSYQTARVRLRALEKAVEDTSVTAPFDGIIEEKLVSPGETVAAQMPGGQGGAQVVTLVKINPLRLLVTVPGRYISQVSQGQKLEFEVDAFPGEKFTGEITRVAPSLESSSRSLTVDAVVRNDEKKLRPGMFAAAELHLPEQRKTVYVPVGAVSRQRDVARVFVSEDGVARERVVTTGEIQSNRIEITSGLEAGDRVVAIADGISDGMKVE